MPIATRQLLTFLNIAECNIETISIGFGIWIARMIQVALRLGYEQVRILELGNVSLQVFGEIFDLSLRKKCIVRIPLHHHLSFFKRTLREKSTAFN